MNFRKILPVDKYYATLTDVFCEDGLQLVFTINTGLYAYRKLTKHYVPDRVNVEKLRQDFADINFPIHCDDELEVSCENIKQQLANFKPNCYIGVDQAIIEINGQNYNSNVILWFTLTDVEPERDVTKPPTDKSFFDKKLGRRRIFE